MSRYDKINLQYAPAICYSGYRDGQSPDAGIYPSYEEVKEDLLLLQGQWKLLRLYDCGPHPQMVLEVIRKEELDFKVMTTPPRPPKNWLVESILVTLFCCLPFGIAGIVHGMNADRAKISWVSSISQNFSWIKAQEVENLPLAETGFFLERAMENGLRAAMSSSSEFFPQFIILSDNLSPGHLPEHLTDWRFMYPGQEHFYHLKEDGKLWAYKWDFPRAEKPVLSHSIPSAIELRLFQHNNRDYYLDTAAGPRLITTKSVFRDFDSDKPLNAWEAGVAMLSQDCRICSPHLLDSSGKRLLAFALVSALGHWA